MWITSCSCIIDSFFGRKAVIQSCIIVKNSLGSKSKANEDTLCFVFFFFVRTSNFGAEADVLIFFVRFEAENVLKMFLVTWYTLYVFQ